MTRPLLGLLHRRECLLPTLRGWFVILLIGILCAAGIVRGIYPFLALQDPVPGGVLVAEGWAPDYALGEALDEFHRHHYAGLFVTGIPIEEGGYLTDYKTYADLSAATLLKMGADPQTVHAVPSSAIVQDRTYGTALALRDRLRGEGISAEKVNVVSLGAHSRRTRLLFEKAFGPSTRVGIVAVAERDFQSSRWWRSSQGFRIVTGELIAYLYARFLFHPAPQPR